MTVKVSGRDASDIRIKGIGAPTYNKLDRLLNAYNSAGILEGGIISDSGSGQVDVTAVKGLIRTSNSETAELVAFNIAGITNLSLTDNIMNFVYIDYNAGTPTWAVTTTYESIDLNTKIIVGRIYRMGSVLYISNVGQDIQNATLRDLYRLQTLRRIERASGSNLSFVAASRYPTVSAGIYFSNYTRIDTAAFDASGASRFTYWYRDGGGGWSNTSSVQVIDNLNYDAGTGTLTALSNNQYGVHWVYQLADGTIHIVYGQASYTIADARNSTAPSTLPPVIVGLGIIIGRFIILKSATTILEASSAFTTTFTGTGTTAHNDLGGIQGGLTNEYYHLSSVDYAVRNLPVVEVTGTTQAMAIRTRYVANNASQVVFTLPSTAVIGDFVEVEGYGAGGWRISQNASQFIIFQSATSTTGTGGYLASGYRYDCVRLRCVATNNAWTVVSATGEITVI